MCKADFPACITAYIVCSIHMLYIQSTRFSNAILLVDKQIAYAYARESLSIADTIRLCLALAAALDETRQEYIK